MTLTLKKKGSPETVKKATTATGGSFTFENVLPGEYVVEATHSTWQFVTVRGPLSQSSCPGVELPTSPLVRTLVKIRAD